MNLAIMLGLGLQVLYGADQMAANASTASNRPHTTAERSIDLSKLLLVGSPELWKFQRINGSFG